MSTFEKIFRVVMIDRQAGQKSAADLRAELDADRSMLMMQLSGAADGDGARKQLAHVIGIERWAQSRLKVALGEAQLVMDEYNGYRPAKGPTLAELTEEFAATRDESIAIADRLASVPNIETKTVMHNGMGEMRVRSWLQYLISHAGFELRKVK